MKRINFLHGSLCGSVWLSVNNIMKNRQKIVILSIKITIFAKNFKPFVARNNDFDEVLFGNFVVSI